MGLHEANTANENRDRRNPKEVISEHSCNELFFALVGPAGAGCTRAAETLVRVLESKQVAGNYFKCEHIKASRLIREWALANSLVCPEAGADKTLERVDAYQNLGDIKRKQEGEEAVALAAVDYIRKKRAEFMERKFVENIPIHPDDRPRAYVVDSFKNPAEVRLFREVYGEAFVLIGVVCEEGIRETRLMGDFFTEKSRNERPEECRARVRALMERDAGENQEDYGQHVTDTFHEADYFVDNTEDDPRSLNTHLNESFERLVSLLLHSRVERPTAEETGMQMAYSAALQSQCLSRQVGACLTDRNGNVLATGTNEVPRAGGGVYGEAHDHVDHRCLSSCKSCSSNAVQNEIISEVVGAILPSLKEPDEAEAIGLRLRKTALGGLLEFSRAVHAEMDAILSAARGGANIIGGRLFVTTFPCHYCARHIVSSGISEVQYIEPYPKSRALELHKDSITTDYIEWLPPGCGESASGETKAIQERANRGKVLFRPFVGVSPRLYPRVFAKDRPYKDKITGEFSIGKPKGSSRWQLRKVSYADLELRILGDG